MFYENMFCTTSRAETNPLQSRQMPHPLHRHSSCPPPSSSRPHSFSHAVSSATIATYPEILVQNTHVTTQYTTPCCNTLQHTATHCNTLRHAVTHCDTLQHAATRCNTLQTHCNINNPPKHAATRCNTLQHTVTHTTPYNTL